MLSVLQHTIHKRSKNAHFEAKGTTPQDQTLFWQWYRETMGRLAASPQSRVLLGWQFSCGQSWNASGGISAALQEAIDEIAGCSWNRLSGSWRFGRSHAIDLQGFPVFEMEGELPMGVINEMSLAWRTMCKTVCDLKKQDMYPPDLKDGAASSPIVRKP